MIIQQFTKINISISIPSLTIILKYIQLLIMSTQTSTVFNNRQIDKCLVCNKQPLPQSSQRIQFIVAELVLLLINFKIAMILLAIGYYFSHIIWRCPVCKRQIDLRYPDKTIEENVIVRLGNCIMMVSKEKYFYIAIAFSTIVAVNVAYVYLTSPKIEVREQQAINSWPNLVRDCGKSVMQDNEVIAHNHFNKYRDLDWNLKGVWISQRNSTSRQPVWNIKMNPTQSPNSTQQDIILYTYASGIGHYGGQWSQGDHLAFQGQFNLLTNQGFHFIAKSITKLSSKQTNISTIPGFSKTLNSNLRDDTSK